MGRCFAILLAISLVACVPIARPEHVDQETLPAGFRAPGGPAAPQRPYSLYVDGAFPFPHGAPGPIVQHELEILAAGDPANHTIVIFRSNVAPAAVANCVAQSDQNAEPGANLYDYSIDGDATWLQPPVTLADLVAEFGAVDRDWDFGTAFIFEASLNPPPGHRVRQSSVPPPSESPTLNCLGPLGGIIPPLH